jgi:arylsulfatase A-like enzyme
MNVLVIAAGGLHLGYVGCYGNDWVGTPTLDRLAAEGVVFDQHYADCPSAAGARRAWRTGRYGLPCAGSGGRPPPEASDDLLTQLGDRGITTCLVVDPGRSVPGEFTAGWGKVALVPPACGEGTALERALEAMAGALDSCAGPGPWLLWLELPFLTPPWEVPEDFLERFFDDRPEAPDVDGDVPEEEHTPLSPWCDPTPGPLERTDEGAVRRLQNSYGAAVAYLDAGLDSLLDDLQQRGWTGDLMICFTADRGLALGEHGIVGEYRPWLHDELIHVPLIVRLPAAAEAGRRVPVLTQSVDLMPTLLDAFGLPIPMSVHGHSLLPLMRGEAERVRTYACAGLQVGDGIEWALRTPEWAYLLPERTAAGDPPRLPQLYVKPEDRWEVNNVVQHHLELAGHLQYTLGQFVKATGQPGPGLLPVLRDIEAETTAAEPATERHSIEDQTET